ncbi:TPA: hypothetical protein ACH3X2_007640 [Trebouxia sp. C0005]
MFFGIGKSLDMKQTLPWSQIDTYGWSYHSRFAHGKALRSHGERWQAGDWVLLKLDLPNNLLSILRSSASTAGTIFMPIPDFADALGHPVFLVILNSSVDHAQVLPVSSEVVSCCDNTCCTEGLQSQRVVKQSAERSCHMMTLGHYSTTAALVSANLNSPVTTRVTHHGRTMR